MENEETRQGLKKEMGTFLDERGEGMLGQRGMKVLVHGSG